MAILKYLHKAMILYMYSHILFAATLECRMII